MKFFSFVRRLLASERGSTSFPMAYVHQFNQNILANMEQREAVVFDKIAPMSKHMGVSGAIDTWERMGGVMLVPIGAHATTPILNPNHTRRGCPVQSIGGACLVSKNVDLVRALINPQSDYVRELSAAAVRSRDAALLSAAVGDAMVITTAAATGQMTYGTQAMITSRIVGTTNTAINLTVIISAGVLLSKGSVPTGPANRVMFYGPGQETDIMAITQASSSDFTANRIMDRGTMNGDTWQGFEWAQVVDYVDQTTWTDDATAVALQTILPMYDTNSRAMIAMARSAVGFSSGQEFTPRVSERDDLNYDNQVYISATFGAVRLWEGAVVEIIAKEN